jgi:putative mRNA 3-end processing factor
MEVRFLGGAREIGRSAVLINESLLLDYGMETGTPPQYPVGDVSPDAVVVSHGHLDHAGAVPALLTGDERPPVHLTPPTYELTQLLARDTLKLQGGSPTCPFTEMAVKRLTQVAETHGYRESFTAAGHEVTLYDAGHVPGSAHVLVDDGDTRLLYTGDFYALAADDSGVDDTSRYDSEGQRLRGQRLVAPSTARPDADVVITESTYAETRHGDRDALEARFADRLRNTVWEGGTAVVPAFAIGRTQEALLICAAHDIDCYVDGMGKRVTQLLREYPEYVRDADALQRAKSNARFVTGRDGQRERIAADNTVIVTTSGMLSGGPAMTYVPAIRRHPGNTVALTGYQVEGTPGRELLDTGRAELDGQVVPVSARVEQYDFSAHADRDGLRAFLSAYEDTRVLVNHGDACQRFAERLRADGYEASAPAVGDSVTV